MPNTFAMTQPPAQPDADAELAWFVHAAGGVWGPYSPLRFARFVAEGRLTPQSLVAAEIEGPFHPAVRWRSLAPLFPAAKLYHHQPAPPVSTDPALDSVPQPAPTPQPTPTVQPTDSPKLDPPQVSSSAAPTQPLLVWAELVSVIADQFEAMIARYGMVVAIRPTVWLLQARCDPAALRNALSRRLTGADALMVVHAPLDQAAWFNLDSSAERKVREVWGAGT